MLVDYFGVQLDGQSVGQLTLQLAYLACQLVGQLKGYSDSKFVECTMFILLLNPVQRAVFGESEVTERSLVHSPSLCCELPNCLVSSVSLSQLLLREACICLSLCVQFMGAEFIRAVQQVLRESWSSDLEEVWKVNRSARQPAVYWLFIGPSEQTEGKLTLQYSG